MTHVFLAQKTLDAWTDQGLVRLEDATLTLVDEGRTLELLPAVRILQVADGSPDPHDLVGKVKTLEQLKALGAEHYFDSVLHGETAYQVDEGFKAALSPAAGASPSAITLPPADAGKQQQEQQGGGTDDAAKLSDLFLNTVR